MANSIYRLTPTAGGTSLIKLAKTFNAQLKSLIAGSGVTITDNNAGLLTLGLTNGNTFNVLSYGAKGDTLEFANFTATSGSAVVSTPSYTFTSADVGKLIAINGAGTAGAMFASIIISISGNSATCAATAGTSRSGNGLGVFGSDDYTGIQAAIDAAKATNYEQGVVYIPAGNYLLSQGITTDPMMVSIDGQGAIIHCECLTTGAAVTVNQANTARVGVWTTNTLRGLQFVGPGSSTTVDGIVFNSSNASFGHGGSCIYDVSVQGFRYGESFGNRSYLIHHFGFKIRGCAIGVYMQAGQLDYGENIAYHGGLIAECALAVEDAESQYSNNFNFFGTSFDFNSVYIKVTKGQVNCYGCHFESHGNVTTESVFQVAGNDGSTLRILGGDFFFNSTNSSGNAPFQVAQPGTIVVRDMLLQNMTNSTGALCQGNGRFIINGTRGYATSLGVYNAQAFGTGNKDKFNSNLLLNGGFEASLVGGDLITIISDTAGITDRYTGTNLTLTQSAAGGAVNGTFALRLTKSGAAGTAAAFMILAPITNRSMPIGSIWYRKPGSETGSFLVETYFVAMQGYDGNGVPIINSVGSVVDGSVTVTATSSAIAYTQFTASQLESRQAPAWATHYAFRIDATSMNACSLYFDNAVINTL